MSVTSAAYYPPVVAFQQSYVSRLAWVDISDLSDNWDMLTVRIPKIANEILSTLDSAVLKSHPSMTARSGKTLLRNQLLFVYTTYSDGTADSNAIVVGVTIERNAPHVIIHGDITNEESGKVYFELNPRSFAGSDEQILMRVKKAAEELVSHSQIVIKAAAEL